MCWSRPLGSQACRVKEFSSTVVWRVSPKPAEDASARILRTEKPICTQASFLGDLIPHESITLYNAPHQITSLLTNTVCKCLCNTTQPQTGRQPLQTCSCTLLGCHSYSAFTTQNTTYKTCLCASNYLIAPCMYTPNRSCVEHGTESGSSSHLDKSYWAICFGCASVSLSVKGGDIQHLEFVDDLGAIRY